MMPLFGLPPVRTAGRLAADVLRRFSTPLGRDAEELLAVFDALPDTAARRAILRTLRSGLDWRGQVITMLDRAYLAEGLPTLLVWGRHDAIIPLSHGRLAHAAALPTVAASKTSSTDIHLPVSGLRPRATNDANRIASYMF